MLHAAREKQKTTNELCAWMDALGDWINKITISLFGTLDFLIFTQQSYGSMQLMNL